METTSFFGNLVHQFQMGGFWMYPILMGLALGLGISMERFIRLYFRYPVEGASFMYEVQKYVLANDIDGAIRVCNGGGESLLPKVLKAGLQRSSRSEDQIQNAIDAASLEVIPKLERNISYLALIANVATLMGLLGTISGLIKSFAAVATADPAQRQAILSAGIAESMNATAFGLITAIIAMIAHSILSNRASKITEEIDEFGVKLLDLLLARRSKHSSEA